MHKGDKKRKKRKRGEWVGKKKEGNDIKSRIKQRRDRQRSKKRKNMVNKGYSGESGEQGERGKKREKIENSRYNEVYKKIQTEEIPEYLRRKRGRKDRRMIARFRCGNETREGMYMERGKGEEV